MGDNMVFRLDLKIHRDKLQQSSRKLEQRASKSHEVARTLVAEGKKTQAVPELSGDGVGDVLKWNW